MEILYFYNDNIMAQCIASMMIMVDNQLQVSYLMGDENAYTWHDHMCQCHTLIAT